LRRRWATREIRSGGGKGGLTNQDHRNKVGKQVCTKTVFTAKTKGERGWKQEYPNGRKSRNYRSKGGIEDREEAEKFTHD